MALIGGFASLINMNLMDLAATLQNLQQPASPASPCGYTELWLKDNATNDTYSLRTADLADTNACSYIAQNFT